MQPLLTPNGLPNQTIQPGVLKKASSSQSHLPTSPTKTKKKSKHGRSSSVSGPPFYQAIPQSSLPTSPICVDVPTNVTTESPMEVVIGTTQRCINLILRVKCGRCNILLLSGEQVLVACDKHTFHPSCVTDYIRENRSCPICNRPAVLPQSQTNGHAQGLNVENGEASARGVTISDEIEEREMSSIELERGSPFVLVRGSRSTSGTREEWVKNAAEDYDYDVDLSELI